MPRRPLVTIRAFQDTTRECMQGRDLAIDYTDEFEGPQLRGEQRVPAQVAGLARGPECSGQAEGRAAARSVPRSNCTVTGQIFVAVKR